MSKDIRRTMKIMPDVKESIEQVKKKVSPNQSESWLLGYLTAMYNDLSAKISPEDQLKYMRIADQLNTNKGVSPDD